VRVTTIDGGFRGRKSTGLRSVRSGLASLTSTLQNSEADSFNGQFAQFDHVYAALQHAISAGTVPESSAVELTTEFLAIGAERDAHRAQLATLDSPAQLMEWHSTGDSIVARANALASSTAAAIGFNLGTRPWQIAVALVGGAIVFGGAAYWLSRRSK